MATVNEKSTSYVSVSFVDKTGAQATPTSVTYRLDCATNSQQIIDWTSVSPAASLEIQISSTQNAIINQQNDTERRVVTVRAVYGASDELHAEHYFIVQNLYKVI